MRRLSLLIFALLFTLAAGGEGQAPPTASAPLVLISAAGRRSLATTMVGDREMVALDDLASFFQLSLREDTLAGAMTIGYKGKSIVVMPDQAIASVGGRLVSLPAPVAREGRRWLVPPDFIPRALALVYDARLDYRRTSRLVVVGDVRVPRLTVREEPQGNQARITFDMTPKTGSAVVQEQSRLLVRFDADALDTTLPTGTVQGLAEGLRLVEPGNTVAIILGSRFASFRATTIPTETATRVVIDLLPALPANPPPVVAPGGAQPVAPQPVDLLPPVAPVLRTIVIDPGHGGIELGVRGAGGTLEKDVTLAVARRLKALVENRLGVRALLTRDADLAVSLDDRAAFANNNRADLFISLHANASLRKDVKGAEVFYLSPDEYAQPQQAGAGLSLPAFGGGSRDIEVVLWDMAQTTHLAQSAALADMVTEELRARVPMAARPVQQAPLRVLVGANMPAVLVELGFLSNAEQEQALAGNDFQGGAAQALFDSVVRFKEGLERRSAGTSPISRPPEAR